MTIRFVVYQKKSESTINVRVTFGRGQQLFSKTPFTVNHTNWSNSKQQTKKTVLESDKETLNDKLDSLKKHISDSVNKDTGNGVDFNKHWLKRIIEEFKRGGAEIEYFDFFLEKYSRKFMFASTFSKRFYEFQSNVSFRLELKTQNTRLSIVDINHCFSEDYATFLLKKGFTSSHARQELARFKMLLKQLRKDGFVVYLDDWFVPKEEEPPLPISLTEEELDLIENYEFNNSRLDNIRTILLLGCESGLRSSDINKLDYSLIKKRLIEIKVKKTKRPITIAVTPRMERLLKKGFISKSRSTLNYDLKELAMEIGLDRKVDWKKRKNIVNGKPRQMRTFRGEYPLYEVISTHIMRRTFATRYYGILPIGNLMKLTGHKTESSFLKYIGKDSQDSALELLKFLDSKN